MYASITALENSHNDEQQEKDNKNNFEFHYSHLKTLIAIAYKQTPQISK